MSWTKRQFVEEAFSEIGMADYVFDLTPSQMNAALKRLDALILFFNSKGIRLGYNASTGDISDLDDDSGLPDSAYQAVVAGLAMRLATSFGKKASIDTRQAAQAGLTALMAQSAKPIERQLDRSVPAGAGNKPWRDGSDPFLNPISDPLAVGDDSLLDFD